MQETICWIISGVLWAAVLVVFAILIRAELRERRETRRMQDAWADIYERSLERHRPRDFSEPPTKADPALRYPKRYKK